MKAYTNNTERDELIVNNIPLVKYCINNKHLGFKFDEVYEIGLIGLINGVDFYDTDKGIKLSTYLYNCISNEINKYMNLINTKKRKGEVVSLNTIVGEDTELQDLLGYEENIDDEIYTKDLEYIIEHRLDSENERNVNVFYDFCGILGHNKLKTDEICKKYNISKPYVYQIVDRFKGILKYEFAKNEIRY